MLINSKDVHNNLVIYRPSSKYASKQVKTKAKPLFAVALSNPIKNIVPVLSTVNLPVRVMVPSC